MTKLPYIPKSPKFRFRLYLKFWKSNIQFWKSNIQFLVDKRARLFKKHIQPIDEEIEELRNKLLNTDFGK